MSSRKLWGGLLEKLREVVTKQKLMGIDANGNKYYRCDFGGLAVPLEV
jgi:hypothetical protein